MTICSFEISAVGTFHITVITVRTGHSFIHTDLYVCAIIFIPVCPFLKRDVNHLLFINLFTGASCPGLAEMRDAMWLRPVPGTFSVL